MRRNGQWALQDAKARFSEESQRAQGEPTGAALVELMQSSPLKNLTFDRAGTKANVRDVEL